jgi:hypothetical protein
MADPLRSESTESGRQPANFFMNGAGSRVGQLGRLSAQNRFQLHTSA